MINILIVDDHAVVRQGLKKILSEEPDMVVLDEAESAEQLLEMIGTKKWDIVILDITMRGKSGLDVLHQLRQEYPQIPILFLSMLPEEQFAVRALQAGAAGYMTKGAAPEDLVKAIRKISAGGKYISSSVAEKLATQLDTGVDQLPHEKLSEREFQVFTKIASGKPLTRIGEELNLSVKTVTTYRTRVLEKMTMSSNAELIRYGIEHKLTE
ncbi:MAG TPA: response regulator transcription factor [Bacteroidota bacterium]|jgi:DNA-binding NarL/FixJ family response regulator|nr:response regulator transcription factor [Bacteroidota bacterium]